MKHFLNTVMTWAMLILAFGLFYTSVTMIFPSSFINIVAFISAVFCLVQGCGFIDREHHFGKYNDENESSKNKNKNAEDDS